MPIVDMSLAELKKYQGRNPRPQDFDRFWDESLVEMKAIDPDVELLPADFQAPFAECFDMYFTGVKGARIYAKLLRPKNQSRKPMPGLVLLHGYSGNSGDWNDKLQYVAAGFTVAALDCRGQGGLSEDVGGVIGNTLHGHIIRGLDNGPKDLLFRHIFLDAAQLAGLVIEMDGVDPKRVGVHGGSQGGGLTMACAALEPRVNRAMPVFPFLSDYLRTWEMDLAKDAYSELREYFRLFDPAHEREAEVFERLGYIDIQYLAPRIQAQVTMVTGLMDTVCPPSTQFAAYNKIKAPKNLIIYPDYGHEGLPGIGDKAFRFMMEMLK